MKLLICTQIIDKEDPILGFFHGWVLEFSKHFEEIHVICLKRGPYDFPPHVHVYSLGKEHGESRLKYLWLFYRYFGKLFFTIKPRYVLFHMGAVYNVLAFPFFLLRKLYGTTFYWWKTHGKLNAFGRLALCGVDAVVTAGSKSFNARSSKVRIVGHAIDTSVFTYHPRVPSRDSLKIMSVGRITPIKKIETSIRATGQVRQHIPHSVLLHHYGPIVDQQYKAVLDAQVREQGLGGFVQFCGSRTQEELRTLYHDYDVLIHPSFEAGLDKVVLEAMACGVIPLSSTPSFEPILGPHGLFVVAEDVQGYVDALKRICAMSDLERSQLTEHLRTEVVSHHALGTLSKRIFGV